MWINHITATLFTQESQMFPWKCHFSFCGVLFEHCVGCISYAPRTHHCILISLLRCWWRKRRWEVLFGSVWRREASPLTKKIWSMWLEEVKQKWGASLNQRVLLLWTRLTAASDLDTFIDTSGCLFVSTMCTITFSGFLMQTHIGHYVFHATSFMRATNIFVRSIFLF